MNCFKLSLGESDELVRFSNRNNLDVLTVSLSNESYSTVDQSIQCVVFTHAHVFTCVVNCSALALDDITSLSKLTTKNFNSKSFAF